MGNLKNVKWAFKELGLEAQLSNKKEDLQREKEGVILPGVGSFGKAMYNLRERGLIGPLKEYILSGGPFLGICLGFQVLFTVGEEGGGLEGLDIFPGRVISFPKDTKLKVPHMGWNQIFSLHRDPLLANIEDGSYQYFVHSYYVEPESPIGLLRTSYGQDFTAGISLGKVYGLQFHPEKGGEIGLLLLSNFISICREG